MAKTIGIEQANGTFYPVLEEHSPVQRRLVFTTVHDNQQSVRIKFYKSARKTMDDAVYIGTIVVENIAAKPKGEPSIKITVSGGDDGLIRASAVDLSNPSNASQLEVFLNPATDSLSVTDLRKRFGRREVVRGVNFLMQRGEVAGLLGPNGAGKTTIFYIISGFHRPSHGRVMLNDFEITAEPMYRRARLGITYLPQEPSVFRKLSVENNIWAILETRGDLSKIEKKERLEQLLHEFGIEKLRRQYGYTLSGGERRRTEIARALALEPKFLLLDEPFAGIDPKTVFELKDIIRSLTKKGIGVLITDHNVRDTLEITTEAFIINDGTIVAQGGKDAILANDMVREVYLGSEFKM